TAVRAKTLGDCSLRSTKRRFRQSSSRPRTESCRPYAFGPLARFRPDTNLRHARNLLSSLTRRSGYVGATWRDFSETQLPDRRPQNAYLRTCHRRSWHNSYLVYTYPMTSV